MKEANTTKTHPPAPAIHVRTPEGNPESHLNVQITCSLREADMIRRALGVFTEHVAKLAETHTAEMFGFAPTLKADEVFAGAIRASIQAACFHEPAPAKREEPKRAPTPRNLDPEQDEILGAPKTMCATTGRTKGVTA